MKISHVKITNILGIKDLELSPEGFTVISGANGQGKTSVLEAIKSVTQSGHDATLLRKGETKGEAVLVLDDGTELSKTVTESGSASAVRRDGKKIASPATTIKSLTDALSVNPVEFLRAPKKDRVKVLLESMPLELDADRLTKISGIPCKPVPGLHALHVIEIVREQVYDDRTGTNRAIKEKDGTINQLRLAMPVAPGGVEGSEDELRAQIAAAMDLRAAEVKRIDDKLAGVKKISDDAIAAAREDTENKIAALREGLQKMIDAERTTLAETTAKATRVRVRADEVCTATVTPLDAAVKAIVADRDAQSKRKVTLETIEKMEVELADLKKDAEAQTKALDGIAAYKEQLLASLPIPGVEVKDGEVFRDGVAFDRLNTSQQVGIAFEIAKLRAGELKVVCLDGIELMDTKHFDELKAQAEASGLQVFVTKVSDENFNVTTE